MAYNSGKFVFLFRNWTAFYRRTANEDGQISAKLDFPALLCLLAGLSSYFYFYLQFLIRKVVYVLWRSRVVETEQVHQLQVSERFLYLQEITCLGWPGECIFSSGHSSAQFLQGFFLFCFVCFQDPSRIQTEGIVVLIITTQATMIWQRMNVQQVLKSNEAMSK